jgi:hypothetical protein
MKVASKTRNERSFFQKIEVTSRFFVSKKQNSRGRRILPHRFLIQIGQDGWLFYVVLSEMCYLKALEITKEVFNASQGWLQKNFSMKQLLKMAEKDCTNAS